MATRVRKLNYNGPESPRYQSSKNQTFIPAANAEGRQMEHREDTVGDAEGEQRRCGTPQAPQKTD